MVKETEQKIVRMWNTGETWRLFDLGADCRKRFGAPYWFVHRGDLHQVLRDAVLLLDPRAIRVGARVMSYEQDATGIRAKVFPPARDRICFWRAPGPPGRLQLKEARSPPWFAPSNQAASQQSPLS
jgi:hypothetical protein